MKRISKIMLVCSLSLFLFTIPVSVTSAQQAGPAYLGVFGSFVMPDDLDTDFGSVDLKDSWAFGVKAGYIFPQYKWFATELEYTYMGKQDVDDSAIDANIRSHNLMVNLLLRYPAGKIHPFIGVGIGLSRGEVEIGPYDENDTAFATQFIAGLNFEITSNFSADLLYKYFYSKYEFEGIDTEANNHILQIGLNYHF